MSEEAASPPPKKKGKLKKMVLLGGGAILVLGAGAGGGVYAAHLGGGEEGAKAEDPNLPKLVKKGEAAEKSSGEGEEGHGGGGAAGADDAGAVTHSGSGGTGGEPYQSTYYQLDKEFTANLRDSPHFVQVGIALATNYDDRVVQNVKGNIIPVRSAILMALADATEESVFTAEGKKVLAEHLKRAVNDVLIQKEGFGGIANVYFTNFIVQ